MKKEQTHLTNEEIKEIIGLAKKPGLRFTVDLYLLDYIKHCFLEDDQLNMNINKLHTALSHLENPEVKRGVEDVIKSLQCVQNEYSEYVEDMRVLVNGGYPEPRGVGQ
jgi:hypothetical protein